ncbi:hypothetical protein [Methanosarcina barkeri]|uniref:hypothetical protein n=1 Tax=Methanosarcina barkeri TaxID=2208 RepID=UPI0018B0B9D2|nr:hypothetical protein [Methanosarcina barkeri]
MVDRKFWQRSNLRNLFPNPIGVINRRNGCGSTVAGQRLWNNPFQKRLDRKYLSNDKVNIVTFVG